MLAALLFALAQDAAGAHAWPCWRGPARTGVSDEVGWSSEGAAAPLWTRSVGMGHSSAAVVDGKLYTLGFDAARELDVIWCLDAHSGEPLWNYPYPATLDADGHGGGTHGTPAVADGVVYCCERKGTVHALDAATGKLLWSRDLMAEEKVVPTDYGFGGSPVVVGERVYVDMASVVALDRASGKTVWKTPDVTAYYSTPTPWTFAGKDALASFTREGLFVHAQADGALLCSFPWRKGSTSVSASSPVIVDAQHLFLSAGYGHGGVLVDLGPTPPVAQWESQAMKTQLSGCVLVGEALYGFDEAVLKCLDLTGKERWRKRGLGQGALMAADGRLLVLSGQGELVVVAADPAAYRELARAKALQGSTFWATPVLCNGLVYVRSGEGTLACLDHRRGSER